MSKFYDVEQNTDEWFSLRAGKIGGSSIGKIMANEGKAFGNPAKDIAVKVVLERINGEPLLNNISSFHLDRGHEQEPIARSLYEEKNFCEVYNGGFFEDGFRGVSPDGLVSKSGVIEIKSVVGHVQFATVKRDDIDPAYKWQCYYNLYVTKADWLDFVSYSADFPIGKQLFQKRIYPDIEIFDRIDERLAQFEEHCETVKKIIMG